ncbi:uncharacterized protein VTP21DRAFT_688 [Calcarisporiella thermophila]|uniref:uncharacterized protein n=1 Tax=Calcarisporiella thermophila TaxID=911321 RepID=UPI003744A894
MQFSRCRLLLILVVSFLLASYVCAAALPLESGGENGETGRKEDQGESGTSSLSGKNAVSANPNCNTQQNKYQLAPNSGALQPIQQASGPQSDASGGQPRVSSGAPQESVIVVSPRPLPADSVVAAASTQNTNEIPAEKPAVNPNSSWQLSTGAIVGVVVGCFFIVAALIFGVMKLSLRL